METTCIKHVRSTISQLPFLAPLFYYANCSFYAKQEETKLLINTHIFCKNIHEMKESETLPKFGDWDLKNPSSATEFSIIFGKARQARKARYDHRDENAHYKYDESVSLNTTRKRRNYHKCHEQSSMIKSNSLLCCFFPSNKS
jgi:hypothetical protein